MKLSKLALVLFGGVALLTVGAPIASAAPAYPQIYWTAQPADPNQPGQHVVGAGAEAKLVTMEECGKNFAFR